MCGVKIEVEVNRPCRSEHSVDLGEALVKERQVLREGHVVAVAVRGDHLELVGAAGETLTSLGARPRADGAQPPHLLRPEGGVDVDEVYASVRERAQARRLSSRKTPCSGAAPPWEALSGTVIGVEVKAWHEPEGGPAGRWARSRCVGPMSLAAPRLASHG